jgi:hypothetical protein
MRRRASVIGRISAEAQVAVPVTATMSLFTSVKASRAAVSVRAPSVLRSATFLTSAGLSDLQNAAARGVVL